MAVTRKQSTGAIGGTFRVNDTSNSYEAGHNVTAGYVHTQLKVLREADKLRAPAPISVRPMCIDDASYVIDSWASSYRRSIVTGPIEQDVFKIEQRARIDRLISRPTSRVFVACDAEDSKKIRGWMCFEAPRGDCKIPIVHYVCVHPQHQMTGIGSALVGIARKTHPDPESFMWTTHETQPMRHVRAKWNLLYNPYLLEVPDRVAAKRATGTAEGTYVF